MATFDDPLIEVVGHDSKHKNGCEHNVSTTHRELCRESTSLLNDEPVDDKCGCLKFKFRRQACLKSKPVILILIWVFLTSVLHWIFIDPNSFVTPLSFILNYLGSRSFIITVVIGSAYMYMYFAILQLFYPLAGYLADVRYGRYRCIACSLWSFIAGRILFGVGTLVAFALTLPIINISSYWNYVLLSVTAIFQDHPLSLV